MRSFFKEPFFQFVVLGALLFIGNGLWEKQVTKSDYTINVDPAEMERQAVIFAGENRRQPTDEDLQALLFSHVEEEVLLREALKLGLGEDDTIIRRRLAQKMRFLIEDTREVNLPPEAELRDWFEKNKAQFVSPEKRSFSHIFFSPQNHGDKLEANAKTALSQISEANWKSLGDPFMLNRSYTQIDGTALERLFGTSFTTSIFAAYGTQWQGPVESAFGLHLFKIDAVEAESTPSFETVSGDVASSWQEVTRRQQNNQRLRDLIDKYKVEVTE